MPVRVTVEIADEDWEDPASQEMLNDFINGGILRVIKVEQMKD